ncbi:hypothetical protein FMN12_06760 [Bacteroides acidifaciens]|uniref:hypothetical protein n=1 Tax=Bacteroides acidifaciens TaxID=85831 RepID=UPI00138F76E0|nr:hypothetical protein [Bacteroides acidifaciens]NDO53589.1 hypothetical protein [Bacteroides acidifaciens]
MKCNAPGKANVCDGIRKWRLAVMHGGRHVLSHRGVLTTEEWRDGYKQQAMERALRTRSCR